MFIHMLADSIRSHRIHWCEPNGTHSATEEREKKCVWQYRPWCSFPIASRFYHAIRAWCCCCWFFFLLLCFCIFRSYRSCGEPSDVSNIWVEQKKNGVMWITNRMFKLFICTTIDGTYRIGPWNLVIFRPIFFFDTPLSRPLSSTTIYFKTIGNHLKMASAWTSVLDSTKFAASDFLDYSFDWLPHLSHN